MAKRFIIAAALAVGAAQVRAADLWNQETGYTNIGLNAVADQEFTDAASASSSSYAVNDVIVGGGGWHVTSIQTEVTQPTTTGALGITQARLNKFANAGSTPLAGNDPTTGTVVSVVVTPNAAQPGVFFVTASGLNLDWAPGEYWVGLTPIGAFNTVGQVFTGYADPAVNAAGANFFSDVRNPAGGIGFAGGSGWIDFSAVSAKTPHPSGYAAMDIVGSPVPEPTSLAILGIGVLAILRRKRGMA